MSTTITQLSTQLSTQPTQSYKQQVLDILTGAGLKTTTVAELVADATTPKALKRVKRNGGELVEGLTLDEIKVKLTKEFTTQVIEGGEADYNASHVAMAKGIVSALPSYSTEFMIPFKKNVPILFANLSPDDADDPDAGTLQLAGSDQLMIAVNLGGAILTADLKEIGVNNVGAKQYQKVLDEGGTKEAALETYYREVFWHETGHVMNRLLDGKLVSLVMLETMKLAATLPEDDKFDSLASLLHMLSGDSSGVRIPFAVIQWIRTNISNYASKSQDEMVAEITALTLGGQPVPKEYASVEKIVRKIALGEKRKLNVSEQQTLKQAA